MSFILKSETLIKYTGEWGIKSVTISDRVTNIGKCAFKESNLESVIIPNGVATIGEGAFLACKNLKSVNIPDSITYVGDGAFRGCINLKNTTIPDSVTTIGRYIFENHENLSGIENIAVESNTL